MSYKVARGCMNTDGETVEPAEVTIGRMRERVFTCPICGMPKVHHRLYGYRCSTNPEHDDIAAHMNEQELQAVVAQWKGVK